MKNVYTFYVKSSTGSHLVPRTAVVPYPSTFWHLDSSVTVPALLLHHASTVTGICFATVPSTHLIFKIKLMTWFGSGILTSYCASVFRCKAIVSS